MSFLRNPVRILLLSHNLTKQQTNHQTRAVKRWVGPTLRELRSRKLKQGEEAPQPRSKFIEWNNKSEIFAFGKRLHENFDSVKLQTAFVNRSYLLQEEIRQRELGIEEPNTELEDNSRLVKKGETIASEYIRAFIINSLPKVPADGITAYANYLRSVDTLAHVATHLGTKDLILSADYPPDNITLCDTLLAVIGALVESSGEERAHLFVRDFICTQLNQKDLNDIWDIPNAVEVLKVYCVQHKLAEPEPRLIGDTAKNTVLAAYQVGIYSDKKMIGKGFGEDIHTAIETASLDALRTFYGINENMKPFNFSVQLKKVENKQSQQQIQ